MCLVMRFISERYHCNLIVSDSVYFVSRGVRRCYSSQASDVQGASTDPSVGYI